MVHMTDPCDPSLAPLRCWEHDDCLEHPELARACGAVTHPAWPNPTETTYCLDERVGYETRGIVLSGTGVGDGFQNGGGRGEPYGHGAGYGVGLGNVFGGGEGHGWGDGAGHGNL